MKTALSPPLPRPRCPQPDTAVATARPAAAGAMTESPEESGTWRAIRALAPALLWALALVLSALLWVLALRLALVSELVLPLALALV